MARTHGSIRNRYVAIIESYFRSPSIPRYVFGNEILGRAVLGLCFARSLVFLLRDIGGFVDTDIPLLCPMKSRLRVSAPSKSMTMS